MKNIYVNNTDCLYVSNVDTDSLELVKCDEQTKNRFYCKD